MTDGIHPDLVEATRLTRAGRLEEATALLQRMLQGGRPAPEPRTLDLAPEAVTVGPPRPSGPFGRKGGESPPRAPSSGWAEGGPGWGLPPKRKAFAQADLVPPGTRFEAHRLASPAGSGTYKLFTPSARHAQGRPLPLLVMLHGCTQSPDDFAAGTRMNLLAEEHGLLVAYPEQSQAANPQRCWNWFDPKSQRRGQGEAALLAGMAREVIARNAVDPARVYVAGLSAGGAAAAILATAYPDLFAAVGIHSGLACGAASDLPSAFAAMREGASALPGPRGSRPVPLIAFHGDRDTTVHPRNGDQILAQAMALADPGLRRETETGRSPDGRRYRRTCHLDAAGRPTLEHWLVEGLGHAWSGGSPAGSYTDPTGPDASRAMLRFFLAHAHPAPMRGL